MDDIRNELSDDYTYFYSGPQLEESKQPNCMTYLDEEISKCQCHTPPVPSQAKPTGKAINSSFDLFACVKLISFL